MVSKKNSTFCGVADPRFLTGRLLATGSLWHQGACMYLVLGAASEDRPGKSL